MRIYRGVKAIAASKKARKQFVDVPATAGDAVLIASAPELAAALRELHDFAAVDLHYRHEERSKAAFAKAAELLKRVGF
jgi:hypothetical protein